MSNTPFRNDDEGEPPTLFGVEEPASDRPDPGVDAPEAGFGAAGGGGFGNLGAIEDDLTAGGGFGGFDDLEDGLGFGPVGDGGPPATLGPPAGGGMGGFGDIEDGVGFGPVDDGGGGLGFGPVGGGDDSAGLFGMAGGDNDSGEQRDESGGVDAFDDRMTRASPTQVADDTYDIATQLAEDDPEEAREFVDTVGEELEDAEGADARETFEQRIDRLDTQRRRRETAASVGATVSGAVGSAREAVSGAVGSVSDALGRGSIDAGDMSTGRDPRASSRPQTDDEGDKPTGSDPRASSRPQSGGSG